jgi:putative salt-induced outer membrane protein YdiY
MKKRIFLLLAFLHFTALGSHVEKSKHSIQVGGTNNTGNSVGTSLYGKIAGLYHHDPWSYEANLEGQIASAQHVESARNLKGRGKITYEFREDNYFYTKGAVLYDKFGTFNFIVREAAGLGRVLIHTPKKELVLEGGGGAVHRRIAGTDEFQDQPIIDLGVEFISHLSKTAEFKQTVGSDISQSNTHIESSTSLKTTVIEHLALEISFKLSHDSVIPQASVNRKKTDTVTLGTLIYTF